MPPQHVTDRTPVPTDVPPTSPSETEDKLRAMAVKQIERRRAFHVRALIAAAVAVLLVVIWAVSEYNNAGGWPTNGFSQSSSIPHEWNIWIIYPLLGLGLVTAIDAVFTYRRRPITEAEIRREIDRLAGPR
jgi:protein-S-isoprenylcysteine O-methyltransferase Ste14